MAPVLVGLLLLQVKHFLGDFVLQTERQVREKGVYGARAGLEHSGIHALLTAPCLLAVGVAPPLAMAAAALEFGAHYHTDWLKARITRVAAFTPADASFWHLFGADQLVHHLTYVAMLWLLL